MDRRKGIAMAMLFLVIFLGGCHHGKPPHTQEGKASWYGKEYQGRTTASGERYNMNDLTAAHPSYPFNTIVEVKNLQNGKSVKVRINDRCPGYKGRIIDLSKRAAEEIDMIRAGVVPVRLEVRRWGGQ